MYCEHTMHPYAMRNHDHFSRAWTDHPYYAHTLTSVWAFSLSTAPPGGTNLPGGGLGVDSTLEPE